MAGDEFAWAIQQVTGDAISRFVFLTVADGCRRGGGFTSTVEEIAAETEAKPKQVRKAMRNLAGLGLIEYVDDVEWGPGKYRPGMRVAVPRPQIRPIPRELLRQRRKDFQRCPARKALRTEISAGLHVCAFCGASDRLTVDHVRPLGVGGLNVRENYRVLCLPCNCSRPCAANDPELAEQS